MGANSSLVYAVTLLVLAIGGLPAYAQPKVTPAEARAIAQKAYIYGYPLLDQYRIMYAFSIDKTNPEYKGPFNTVMNVARVYTPDDTAFVSPNADTPYMFMALDLRAEPIVLTVPAVEKGRYYSFQMMDLYTYNFAYVGSRTSGNAAGRFLIAGPNWKGETPKGIEKVIRAETKLISVVGRTQLFGPDDLENVKKIQAGYKVQPLSQFHAQQAPKAAPVIEWPNPLSPAQQRTNPEFFNLLSFLLQFCPATAEESKSRDRFARIRIAPGKLIYLAPLSDEMKKALKDGMADGQKAIDARRAELAGKTNDLWGTRQSQKSDFLLRAVAAQVAIGANSREEAIYEIYEKEATGERFDGSKHRYVMRFAKGQEPPVKAFWSLTMYNLPGQFLVKNPINRYLINSPMLPNLKRDDDGGLTIYIQKGSPGKDKESNWLPAPDGPFMMALRLYLPGDKVLKGEWKVPQIERVK